MILAPRTFALIALFAAQATAAPPSLDRLQPAGAQRGKTFRLDLEGRFLPPGAEIETTLPAAFTPLAAKPAMDAGRMLSFLVELEKDAAVGLYPLRIKTTKGLSNALLFSVGEFPDITEHESEADAASNNQPRSAQQIAFPAVVHGMLTAADRDVYKIQAKAGQQIAIAVEARRAASAVDPVLRISDSSGRQIAMSNDAPLAGLDARLAFTPPADGEYFLTVHDARFSDQAANFYHLKFGRFDFAEGLFPLGWSAGATTEVEWYGGTLAEPARTAVDLTEIPREQRLTAIPAPGRSGAGPVPFAVSSAPENLESANRQLARGEVLNARISEPGEIDEFTLAVTPGESLRLTVEAAELRTTPLYPLLSVYAGEKLLERAGDEIPEKGTTTLEENTLVSRDPAIALTVPEAVTELRVVIEDLIGRGGPHFAYRLLAETSPPDFYLTLNSPYINVPAGGVGYVAATVHRRGYSGPVKLTVKGHRSLLRVAGGNVSGDERTKDRVGRTSAGRLALLAEPDAAGKRLDLEVWGEATLPDGTKLRRRATGPGVVTGVRSRRGIRARELPAQAFWLGMGLPAMISDPMPARIEVADATDVRLVKGTEYQLRWTLATEDPAIKSLTGFDMNTIGGRELRTAPADPNADYIDGKYIKYLRTTIGGPEQTFDVTLTAQVKSGGTTETITSPIITVHVVDGYELLPPAAPLTLSPNATGELSGQIQRDQAFPNVVLIEATNLPNGVSCEPVSLPEGETSYKLPCRATAEAAAGEYEFEITSSSTMVGLGKGKDVRYQVDPITAQLRIL